MKVRNDTDWCAINNLILLPPPNCQKVHDSNHWPQILIQSHPTKTVRRQPTTWSVMRLTHVISYGQDHMKGEMWSLVGSIWWALPPSSSTQNSKLKKTRLPTLKRSSIWWDPFSAELRIWNGTSGGTPIKAYTSIPRHEYDQTGACYRTEFSIWELLCFRDLQ